MFLIVAYDFNMRTPSFSVFFREHIDKFGVIESVVSRMFLSRKHLTCARSKKAVSTMSLHYSYSFLSFLHCDIIDSPN